MRLADINSSKQIFLTVLFVTNFGMVNCRTTKSRIRGGDENKKTTRAGGTRSSRIDSDSTTIRLPDLLAMPQNDIYNNEVDEDIDLRQQQQQQRMSSVGIPTLAPPVSLSLRDY